ncbi:uncharacterized protein LOC110870033 [Helianthus annuus]|uniref:uncharacterized protein LOC110870033 n=1 Tax=Helianthus annuus TaxID=4232 RepID=UPI000B8FF7BC|nr:uncharacterized protein LOC110870033 [Helianthus annuus]
MNGRDRGRGDINLTKDQLMTLINARVAEALAAQPGGQPAQPRAFTFRTFMDCKPRFFNSTEGAVGLLHWIEKVEYFFEMCDCPVNNRVKYATGTLEGNALPWWNAQVQMLRLTATPWNEFKDLLKEEYFHRENIQKIEVEYYNLKMVGSEIEAYTKRSNDLVALCPNMSEPSYKRIELYLKGLAPEI